MIFLINAEKSSDKVQHPFLIENIQNRKEPPEINNRKKIEEN